MKSNKDYSALSILKFDDLATAKEIFIAFITISKEISGTQAEEIKLKNTDDEYYAFKSKNAEFARIIIRKKIFIIEVTAPNEILAEKFAHYIVENMPNE